MSDTRFAADPYSVDPVDFAADVWRYVDMYNDDLGLEVQVETGVIRNSGPYVEVLTIRDSVGVELPMSAGETPVVFYSVDDFKSFVERFTPEDY